jgi:ubiquinone/menaquinone biosynthesis C-methylase UbiE
MLITGSIFRFCHSRLRKPMFEPDKNVMVKLITYERERLLVNEDFKPEEYWKDYLLGKGANNYGYDFYRNIKDFREFLDCESRLIDFKDGEILGDMGCGTGLFIENMLKTIIAGKKRVPRGRLILVDLVQEALQKTKSKIDRLVGDHRSILPRGIEYKPMNLDPNRLIPVHAFMNNTHLDVEALRNAVEGLKNTTIDALKKLNPALLYPFLRGGILSHDNGADFRQTCHPEQYAALLDINRAARFLRRDLKPDDIIPAGRNRFRGAIKPDDYKTLRTGDLVFEKLRFGDCGLELSLDFKDNSFDKIVASLFISYLFNPQDILHDFFRMLKPGGRIVVSSMKPDSDISVIFTDYITKVHRFELDDTDIKNRDQNIKGARSMLNEAASLFEMEEEGYFKFYSGQELAAMLEKAGFITIKTTRSMGKPPQAVIVTAVKKHSASAGR